MGTGLGFPSCISCAGVLGAANGSLIVSYSGRIKGKKHDGFEIARADLAQRGPGDFFGQRQHGLPALYVADLAADLALMQSAREEAERLLADDPGMEHYPELRARVERMFRSTEVFN